MHDSDPPILDLSTALEAMDNDRQMYEEILSMYLSSTISLFSEMDAHFHGRDYDALSRSAHTLKSSSRTIGGLNLGSHAEELEHKAASLSPDAIAESISGLRSQFIKLCAALSVEGFAVPLQR